MVEYLASPQQLTDHQAVDPSARLEAAEAAVRRYCGWHIARAVTETLVVESEGTHTLLLPSMHVTAVTEVRDVTTDNETVLDGWRNRATPRFRAGILERTSRCWPCGVLEVDLTHGYPEVPVDVRGVVIELAESLRNATVTRRQVGAVSEQYADEQLTPHHKMMLDHYKLPASP